MQFKFKKSTKPAEVPRLGWTIFIGLIGLQGFIGIFDSVFNETLTDRLGSGAVGIGFSLWAILRVTQMKNFEYKLRKQPSLPFTIFYSLLAYSVLLTYLAQRLPQLTIRVMQTGYWFYL